MTDVTLTWPRRSTFRDNERGKTFEGKGSTVTVDNNSDRYDQYLERGWVEGEPADVLDDEDDAAEAEVVTEPEVDPAVFVDAFVAQSATDQAESIEAGDVDAYLDEIEQANADGEDYATVADAIESRRAELQG